MDEKVIEFRPADLEVAIKPREWDGSRYCPCDGFWVDEHRRVLECRVCGKIKDPFDYLKSLAYEGRNLMTHIARLKEELTAKHTELAALKGQVQRARATVRRNV